MAVSSDFRDPTFGFWGLLTINSHTRRAQDY